MCVAGGGTGGLCENVCFRFPACLSECGSLSVNVLLLVELLIEPPDPTERDRHTDRQTDRQTDIQTGRQADKQADIQTDLSVKSGSKDRLGQQSLGERERGRERERERE